jgi:hypothetical protein
MWSPDPTIGGAQWRGNATLATTRQLNNISTTLTNQLLSTSIGLQSTITGTSNYLQTEINAIVSGGGAALWSQYGAIHNVDISGYKITNAKTVSTQELFTSSINGNDVNFFGSTVTVGGVTFVGGAITTSNITVQPAKGGGGGGGNNPTTGGSGNNTFTMVNNAVGAVMDTVSKTQQAIGGILNNTGAVLFQTYYAVETAGAIIDLANGAVQLATNAQAMYDTREQNLIAGPGGPPGQTSYVYETISGTTQLQFSTIGAPVYSVFRTTDQVNPNKTFGREIFTSTIIPAGSKVVRSVSDPYQFPIMSTQAISTTNYLQSFGQWHAILEPDYNLKTSTLTASSVQSYSGNISTLTVSSLNGFIPISSQNLTGFLSTVNLSSFFQISTPFINASSISTNYLYATNSYIKNLTVSTLTASTIVVENVIDNYVSTTTGFFDAIYTSSIQGVLTPYLNSTTTQTFDSISSIYQPIINAVITGSDSGPQQFGLQDFQIFDAANIVFWNGKSFKKFYAGTCVISFNAGGIQNGAYIDISVVSGATINVIDRGGLVISLTTPGTTKRLTWSASSVVFVVTTAPAPTITTLANSFQLGQSFDAVLISTPYQLVVNAGETIFNQQLTANDSLIGNSFSYLSTLQTNGITFSSAPNQPYDLTNTFTSTAGGVYDNVSSLTQNILNYNLSANLTGEPVIYLGASFTCQNNDGSWAGQFMIARGFSEVFLYTANATNYFDIQNQAPTQIVTVYLSINGNVTTFLRLTPGTPIYRVTATVTAGVTVWTYALSPGVITPSFVQNNLTISQDLQRVYISSMNTIQFNAGDIYMNGPLEAQTGIFNTTAIQQAFISSISTGSLFAGFATYENLTVTSFTSKTASMSTATISNAYMSNATISSATISNATINDATISRITGGTFYSKEVGTNVVSDYITLSTGFTTVGLTQYRDSYNQQTDNLIPVRLIKSQMSYYNYPGWNGTYNNIYLAYVNSNGDVFLNGSPNTVPRNFNITSAVVTLGMVDSGSPYYNNPSLYFESPSQNFKAAALSNDIYAFFTFTAGSNPFALTVGGPGAYLPNTYNSATNYAYQLTLVSGGAVANKWQYTTQTRAPYTLQSTISVVSLDHSPANRLKFTADTVTMSALSNVDFLTSNVTFNNRQAVRWDQSGSVNIDAHGGNWAYGETNILLTNPWSGLTYSVDWEPTCTLTTIRPNQQNLAINAYIAYVFVSGSVWYCKVFIQTATVTGTGAAHDVPVTINVTMTPKPFLSYANPGAVREEPNFSTIYAPSTIFSRLEMPEMFFSSITSSTLTIKAYENIAILGDLNPPTFLGTGDVAINANSNIDLMANYDIIAGAGREIDMTGASTIRFTSPEIRAHGYTTVKVPGTASIPSVSPLALTNGNDYAGTQNKSQIELQFYGGGFNHFISSRHNANTVYDVGNAIDFWLYSVTTGGNAQTASSAPGTGNINVMSITAGNVVINRPLYSVSDFNRRLSGSDIVQPIIQYGTDTGSGASGSVTVTLPVAYTSSNSYVAFASMMDVDAARMSVNRDSASQITIYWFQAGSGTQTLGWQTSGT